MWFPFHCRQMELSLLSAAFKGSSWGCHPCAELKNQMSSLSSEIAALKAKWHRTTVLFHTAENYFHIAETAKNDSMALANDTWSDSFLSKHSLGNKSWRAQMDVLENLLFILRWDFQVSVQLTGLMIQYHLERPIQFLELALYSCWQQLLF